MKFQTLFDFRLFVKKVENSITDDAYLLKLKSYANEIPDKEYYLLSDDLSSYINECKFYSKDKKFFKNLQKEKLTFGNLSHLYAFMTHLSIALNDRMKVRKEVKLDAFNELREIVQTMIDSIINNSETENKLRNTLQS